MVRFMPVLTVRGCGWIAKCEIRARTLWSGHRGGGGGMRWTFGGHGMGFSRKTIRGRFRQIAQLPYATVRDRCGWMGSAVMPVDAPRCVFDKSRSYPMQPSGDRCRWVGRGHAGGGPTVRFRQIAQLPCATVWRPMQAGECRVRSVVNLRQGGTLRTRMRSAEHRQDTMKGRPPGACPGGETGAVERRGCQGGSVAGFRQGRLLRTRMRSAELRQDTMIRETVRLGGVDAGGGSVASLRQGGTPGPEMRSTLAREGQALVRSARAQARERER